MFLGILKCKRVSSPGNLRIICRIVILIVTRYNTDIFLRQAKEQRSFFAKSLVIGMDTLSLAFLGL